MMRIVLILIFFTTLFSQSDVSLIHIESTLKTTPIDLRFDYEKMYEGRSIVVLLDAVSVSYIRSKKGREYISSNSLLNLSVYLLQDLTPSDAEILSFIFFLTTVPNFKLGGVVDKKNYFVIGQNSDYYFFYKKDEVYTETLISYGRLFGPVMVSNTLSYCWNGAYSRKKGFHYRVGVAYVFGE